ncbi:MAG: hypothetical protein HeimC3_07790 [Candidatus Heimdallarchaeota archaeon LC_3]|nr:MAG: hypothetical protein HeimC3_07790 [Candidatus Heimdallarchaeota archaeon LC_3]
MWIIFFQSLQSIKKRIDSKIKIINDLIERELNDKKRDILILNKKQELIIKNKRLNFIIISFTVGLIFAVLGLLPNVIILGGVGMLIAFVPQAYILSKDNVLFLYLLTQKVKENTTTLQKNFTHLQQQSEGPSQIPQTEIQALMNFIERADTLYFDEES